MKVPPAFRPRASAWRRTGTVWCAVMGSGFVAAALAEAASSSGSVGFVQRYGDWLGALVHQHGLWVGLPMAFLGGLLLNLTPCVYPMIPVTLAFFSAQTSSAPGRPRATFHRAARLAACYVLGIALNYAVLGLLAAKTGSLFGAWLQQPMVLIGVAAIIVALSLSLFGFYELTLPAVVRHRLGQASTGAWGAFLMGLVVGLVAAPCIGPVLLALLLVASQLANPFSGFLLFFVLGLGMGLPYVVLGMAAPWATRLPKSGLWLLWCKQVLGLCLLGLALWFLRPLVPSGLFPKLVAGLLIGAGFSLGWGVRVEAAGRWFRGVRSLSGLGLLLAAILVVWPRTPAGPTVTWIPYSEPALEEAQRSGRPTLVDVYADWCIPCVEMDHVTFRHPEVVRALAAVNTLRLDVTESVSPDGERLLEHYQIFGAPTVLLFDRTGRERGELRLLGFVQPKEFLGRLDRLR